MTNGTIPLILAGIGLIVALNAYRNIRRGAARYYTLEREALLRQAALTLIASVFFFLAAVALLSYNVRQLEQTVAVESGEVIEGVPTITPTLSIFPPTSTPEPTSDLTLPTPTATPIVRRALVDGTGGNGLYLRESPNGEEMLILPDGTRVSVMDEPAQDENGIRWLKIRTVAGEEGWVAETFLIIQDR